MGDRHSRLRRAAQRGAVALVALAAVAASSCTAPGGIDVGRPSGTLTVLSYNVAGLPAEVSKVDPTAHIPLIAPKLEGYPLVLTQEDFDWWHESMNTFDFVNYHDRLRASSTHPYRSSRHPGPEAVGITGLDPARPYPFVGDGLGYLSRFPTADDARVPWPGCFGGIAADGGAADCLSMKGFSVSTVWLGTAADGRRLEADVYNVHGEAGGTAEDQRLQAVGYRVLAEHIRARSAGRAVILAGDTNLHSADDHPDSSDPAVAETDGAIWQRFLSATGLTDACAATACAGAGNIDKAAVRSGGGVELVATSWSRPSAEFRDPQGAPLSDHAPLVVGISWAASTAHP